MMRRSRSTDEAMAEVYARNPALAMEVINQTLAEGDQGELLVILRQLSLAHGGPQNVANDAGLNPTQIYRTLSASGNPSLSSFLAILKAMNLRLTVQPASCSDVNAG